MFNKLFYKSAILLLCGLFATMAGFANGNLPNDGVDTLRLDISQAEHMFIDSNLQILAQKYNVDATKALIIQAKLYPNPNIGIAQSAYDPWNGKWFETGANAEEAYQVSQLIVLSRKIRKQDK